RRAGRPLRRALCGSPGPARVRRRRSSPRARSLAAISDGDHGDHAAFGFLLLLFAVLVSDFGVGVVSVFASDFASLAAPSLLVSAGLASPSFFAPGEAYRSEYQPLPLSTNEVREIRRFTLRARHFGQTRIGSSLIRCSASNSCLHFSHAYSYTGIADS